MCGPPGIEVCAHGTYVIANSLAMARCWRRFTPDLQHRIRRDYMSLVVQIALWSKLEPHHFDKVRECAASERLDTVGASCLLLATHPARWNRHEGASMAHAARQRMEGA
jgi:hypothetical protein